MYKKLLLIILFPVLTYAQHTIKGTFTPAEEYKWAILYRIEPEHMFYTANTQVKEDGTFTLELDKSVPTGIYRLVYALPQEIYNFDIIYNGTENIELTFSADNGLSFHSSEENILLSAYESVMSEAQEMVGLAYQESPQGSPEVQKAFVNLELIQNQFEKDAAGYLAFNFVKANRPYIPRKSLDFETYLKNYKENYFKYVDFNDPILQKSGFPTQRALNYIEGFTSTKEDKKVRYNENIDAVALAIKNTDSLYQKALLGNLWQELVNDENINAANHLAEKHLIPIADSLDDKELSEKLTLFKNLSIGSKAPDFSWEQVIDGRTLQNSLHKIDGANNYILVFWSSGCSHCLKEVPLLHDKIKNLKKGDYKVIAIGLEDEPYDWRNKIFDFPEFVNVLGLGKWENEIGNKYDVISTPTYFILDKDKNIIAKPEHLEDVVKIIDNK
tara:strand:+ start:57098 stop:58426 length:1329 start_codon:yes stop_codon:yes gene_type:complete